ncbi:MAG: UbiA-like polyprenyltransferase [Gemmatimonadota bacterium]|jgi:4-hydroxybenzoate polyprenyltransferase
MTDERRLLTDDRRPTTDAAGSLADGDSVAPGADSTSGPREGQTFAGDSLASRYASFVKLPHTLFALPFAGVGVVLASYRYPDGVTMAALLWVVVAFTAARFAAMGFNRIVDRAFDAENPRTRRRELPTGRLTLAQAWVAVFTASAAFVFAAWRLNALCGWLAPVALMWVFLYSYTKRFTTTAHLALGLGLSMAPVGAYLAITGAWSRPWWALVLVALAVTFWVAGFDVIYSFQDVDYDRARGLYSLPARFGLAQGARIARGLHGLAVVAFFLVWALHPFAVRWFYLAAVGVMAVLLHYEHRLVHDQVRSGTLDLARIDRAFFHVNVGVSSAVFLLTLLDRLLLA